MSKKDIFSKIQIKDYNNILEDILEQKDFSEDVKNLLLSMFYKIENAYNDYKVVKVNVTTKSYFLKKIVQIIKEECKEIKLIKPLSEESKELEERKVNYIVNSQEGKIKVYPNEGMILEALIELNQKEIILENKYSLFEIAIKELLSKGNKINKSEVIRDFNGWSWNITPLQIEDKDINLVYQNLLMLFGNKFLQNWITDEEEIEEIEIPNNEILRSKYNEDFGITKEEMKEENKIDYIEKMQEILESKCDIKTANTFLEQLIKTIIVIGCNNNEEQKEIILKEKKEVNEKLEKMQDNREYLEEISKNKKEITLKIKNIDTILSDEKLLRQEYEERNSKLENKQKIFSPSHLVIMLEKQRKQYLEEIKYYNKQMEPKEFVREKQELENKHKFFEEIGIEDGNKTNVTNQLELLQNAFLDCIDEIIENVSTKKELIDLIYEIRYYKQILCENSNIKEVSKLKIEDIEKKIIKKVCAQKILTTFTNDEILNYDIIKNLFQSKIINLENTIYTLKYHKGILKITIYDTNIEEDIIEIRIFEKVELEVRLNKKIKVFE